MSETPRPYRRQEGSVHQRPQGRTPHSAGSQWLAAAWLVLGCPLVNMHQGQALNTRT